MERSEVVVIARVVAVDVPPGKWSGDSVASGGPTRFNLEVLRAWKGARAGDRITIARETISDCDYPLAAGSTHVLYLRRDTGRLDSAAPHCGRSVELSRATQEIAALDEIAPSASALANAATSASPSASPATSASGPPSAPAARGGCAGCAIARDTPRASRGWLVVALAAGAWLSRRRRA